MASGTDWAFEMAKNGRMPESTQDMKEMMKQMDDLGWKGVYNPKNCYPKSPFLPSSPPTPDEVRKQAKFGLESVV
ncbi:hypothetical protein B0J14DRAFT_579630 [Halenospora varia]|nr:hypothetical protein B0J14DRAFT_579630 [Halenospora varia]